MNIITVLQHLAQFDLTPVILIALVVLANLLGFSIRGRNEEKIREAKKMAALN